MNLTLDSILALISFLAAAFVGGCGWLFRLAGKLKADELGRIAEATQRANDKAQLEALARELHEVRASIVKTSHQYAAIDAKMTLIYTLLGGKMTVSLDDAMGAVDEAATRVDCNGPHRNR